MFSKKCFDEIKVDELDHWTSMLCFLIAHRICKQLAFYPLKNTCSLFLSLNVKRGKQENSHLVWLISVLVQFTWNISLSLHFTRILGWVEGMLKDVSHILQKNGKKWPLQKNVQKWHRMAKHGKTPNRISRTSKQLVYCYRQWWYPLRSNVQ